MLLYRLRVLNVVNFPATLIQGKFFVQTGNQFPNTGLCKPFRSKRMVVL